MAKQLQLRRGTTVQNDAFTGAIGELTMDTDKKQLRLHDGATLGGIKIPSDATADYVVEFQAPTAGNNYTWYRKYKSGWVEQGGRYFFTAAAYDTYNLVVAMANTDYTIQGNFFDSTASATGVYGVQFCDLTTTTFKAKMGTTGTNTYFMWEAKGMAA